MKATRLFCVVAIGLVLLVDRATNGQTQTKNSNVPAASKDFSTIVKNACKGAATVGRTVPQGKAGRTVVILEEAHDSLAVQLELAAILVRLHAAGLKELVLEGYLRNDGSDAPRKPVSREWFRRAAGELPGDVQREVAARLLKEGEISAAEFLFLAYDDVRLIPGESLNVRGGDYGEEHVKAVLNAVSGLSEAVLKEAIAGGKVDVGKFNGLAKSIENSIDDKAKGQAVRALMEYIITFDPWLKSAYGRLTNTDLATATALTDQARLHDELIAEAKKRGVEVDVKLLKEGADFFRQREKANDVLVEASVSSKPRLIVLNVGAAHTGKIIELLQAQGFGAIVVTPLSMKGDKGKLTSEQFNAKLKQHSVFENGPIATALKTLPGNKKPEPSITEAWCQAKGELYLLVSRLTRQLLGPPGPPGGGEPPFGLTADAFRGSFFVVDPRKIRYLAKDKAILFPIATKDDPENGVLWIKSIKSDHPGMAKDVVMDSGKQLAPAADADRLVAQLLSHRDEVNRRDKAPSTAEDKSSSVGSEPSILQVDIKSLAAFGTDEKSVAAAVVSTR